MNFSQRNSRATCPTLHTVAAAAALLGISQRTLRRMIADRRISAVRIGQAVHIPMRELHRIGTQGLEISEDLVPLVKPQVPQFSDFR